MERDRHEVMIPLTQGMKEMKEKESRIPLRESSNNRNSRIPESKDSVS